MTSGLQPAGAGAKPWWRWIAIGAIIVVFDQITKALIRQAFTAGETLVVTPFFNLVLAYNTGAAFSFLAGAGGWQRMFFIVMTFIICAFLLWLMRRHPENRVLCTGLALVLGGAVGNLYDRLVLGHVVDFIQLHAGGYYWPAFNVADSAITVGAGLIILDSFRKPAVQPGGTSKTLL